MEDWVDEDGRALEPPPYIVKSKRCWGCVAQHDEQQKFPSDEVGLHTHFEIWRPDED